MREKWPVEKIEFDSRQSYENFDIYGIHLPSGKPSSLLNCNILSMQELIFFKP